MRSISRWLWVAAIAATVWASPLRAADKLESIVKKESLTQEDKARLDQEVEDRARRLVEAGTGSASDREESRGRLLETMRVSGATDAALTFYAARASHHLSVVVLSPKRGAAEDAALVLRSINRPETARSLVTGLRSSFPTVQYHCAVGIRDLHSQIGNDRSLVADALEALGDIGAATSNEALLRATYEAINFAGAIDNFPAADQQANALTKVLKARLKQLSLGSQDSIKDAAGYAAALAIGQTKTSIEAKRELLATLVGLLEIHAQRYGNQETHRDYLPTLRQLVGDLEKAIQAIMRSEGTNPPSATLAGVVSENPSGSQARAAMDAIQRLRQTLKADPWKIG